MDTSLPDTFIHKTIPVNDTEQTNILKHFDSCIQFLEFAVSQEKSVLVHCVAGMSRSVAVLCAYLMKTNQQTYTEAINHINTIDAGAWYFSVYQFYISPNAGFVEQLGLFCDMGYAIDPLNDAYKQFRITTLATEYQG